jgi:hypothetical protein
MFSFTGLTPKQCEVLSSKWHVYLLSNGRISMCGINSQFLSAQRIRTAGLEHDLTCSSFLGTFSGKNIDYLAKAINDVVVNVK